MIVSTNLARASLVFPYSAVRSERNWISEGQARTTPGGTSSRRRSDRARVCASSSEEGESENENGARPTKRRADSTDAVASFLSRRFGLRGGLAWVGVLAFGVISEQIKTRREIADAERNTKENSDDNTLYISDGLTGKDLRVGGGDYLREGDLCVINYQFVDNESGNILFDTYSKKPIAFVYGSPLLELENEIGSSALKMIKSGLDGMRAGGKRVVTGPDVSLNLELSRVSIAPS